MVEGWSLVWTDIKRLVHLDDRTRPFDELGVSYLCINISSMGWERGEQPLVKQHVRREEGKTISKSLPHLTRILSGTLY
jgi:hypothetical protein